MIQNTFLKIYLLGLLIAYTKATEILEARLLSEDNSSLLSVDEPDEVLKSSVKNYNFNVDSSTNFTLQTEDFPNELPAKYNIKVKFSIAENVSFYMDCNQFNLPCDDNSISFKVESGKKSVFCSEENQLESKSFFSNQCFEKDAKLIMKVNAVNASKGFSCRVYGKPCKSSESSKMKTLNYYKCGKSTGTRIINGQNTDIRKFPWAVELYSYYNGFTSFCGGSIIDNKFILTAAHCVLNSGQFAKKIMVKAGCYRFNSCTQIRYVSSYSFLSSYTPSNIYKGYDIAVLKLSYSLSYNSYVNSVCLPSSYVPMGYHMTTIGWGVTSVGGSSLSYYLKEAEMISVVDSYCSAQTYRILCAMENSGRTCYGDSGSFMGSIRNNRYEIDGITSYGRSRCLAGYASGFTEVKPFVSWINSIVARM